MIPLYLVAANQLSTQLQTVHADAVHWVTLNGFSAQPGSFCLVPMADGRLAKVLVGSPETMDPWVLGNLAQQLPTHTYYLADAVSPEAATNLYLGWRLGQYRFSRYKQEAPKPLSELVPPEQADTAYVDATVTATYLVRDLINTPANDMGPEQIEAAARQVASTCNAKFHVITGIDLLQQNYPLIYAVGQASAQASRLIELRWGNSHAPKVTLVGKGVCFDTGGLDIKSSAGMKMMKKDMGGAAQTLGLAHLIMQMNLPVCLRVLIPAVENSIAGNAMRPLDVIGSRKGITVEIGNTDAEGRLVLADALWEACSEMPALLINCATLTGAARIALGTEVPAFFCNHPTTTHALNAACARTDDPLWQLPLHQPYRSMLDSPVADINNISGGSYGGAITAALFLQEFVDPGVPWIHLDFMAYNLRSLPGRPEGGDAMGMRALFELVRSQFTS
jgi:leucyl aminopeptidase